MYTVEGIKENVQRTHVVESNKYIIYIAPKNDWQLSQKLTFKTSQLSKMNVITAELTLDYYRL